MAGFIAEHKKILIFLLEAICAAVGVVWADVPLSFSDSTPPAEPVVAVQEQEHSDDEWLLRIVSFEHPLDPDFQVPLAYFRDSGYRVDYRIIEDLGNMFDAAAADGVYLRICSAYRSVRKQASLYDQKVAEYRSYGYSKEEASLRASYWVGYPERSEHHTGLALDIVSTRYAQLDDSFANSDAHQWMMQHAAEYGFILRYPRDKTEITGIHFEPWHWRYVGHEHAAVIKESGLTLEEYVAQLD